VNPAKKACTELLDRLDIRAGDIVYQHTSFKRLIYLGLSPAALIDAMLERLGDRGTLAMPSMVWNLDRTGRPWKGYADYFRERPVLDVRHTACNFGVVPELFRQMPGTLRTVNRWTICARGYLAQALTDGQEVVSHPFGPDSAFERMRQYGVKILGLGCSLNTNSLAVLPDFQLGEQHPQQIFTAEPLPAMVIDYAGRAIETQSHWYLPEASRVIKPAAVWDLSPRLVAATCRADVGDTIHFCYPFAAYHEEALRLGKLAIAEGGPVPWLRDYPLRTPPALRCSA
jgi:aminoglycoside N3'-acetyltransferase